MPLTLAFVLRPAPSSPQQARLWSSRDFTTYQATYAFSYILCGTYIIMFFLLIFAKGEMQMQAPERGAWSAGAGQGIAHGGVG